MHSTATPLDSAPFPLVKRLAAPGDVMEDADTTEVPASRSVPPRLPPTPLVTTENDLPSVIVELNDLEMAERDRASEVDGLLVATENLEGSSAMGALG